MNPLEHWKAADQLMTDVEVAKVRQVSTMTVEAMVNQAKTHAALAAAGFRVLAFDAEATKLVADDLFKDLFAVIRSTSD